MENEKSLFLKCTCGGCGIEFSEIKFDEEPKEVNISIWTMVYAEHIFYKIKERIKTAWKILTKGKECLYDIILSMEDVGKLKNFLLDF